MKIRRLLALCLVSFPVAAFNVPGGPSAGAWAEETAAPTPPSIADARQMVAQGLELFKDGDPQKGLARLRQARDLRPNNPYTLSVLAQIEALSGDSNAALSTLTDLADLKVAPADILTNPSYASLEGAPRLTALAERFKDNTAPRGTAARFAVADKKIPLAESLAYDQKTGDLYLGAMVGRRIEKRAADGTWTTFAATWPHGLYSISALKIDPHRRILWAASPATDITPDLKEGEEGRSALFGFDLETGRLKHKITLADGTPHWFGDFEVMENGNLIISDSLSPTIFLMDVQARVLLPFITNPNFVSLQGLAMNPYSSTLIVADYATGLFVVDLQDETVTSLTPARGVVPYGIDGLYRYGEDLIAIQNGTNPQRITMLTVDLDTMHLTSQRVLVQGHPDHFEPTLGQIVDDKFLYVANSGWPLFGSGKVPTEDELPMTVVLSTDLPENP